MGYKANIEATIRAMVDGAMSSVFADSVVADEIVDSDSSDDDTDDDDDDDDDDDEAVKSSGIPLGLTLEIILEFMEQANHPGQDEDDDEEDEDDDSYDGYTNGRREKNELRYAGGKILCLLGNPPLEAAPPTTDSLSYANQSNFYQGGVAG